MVRDVPSLPDDQRALLAQTLKAETSCRVRARAHRLVLRDQGTTSKDMAKTSQVDRDTMSSWLTQGAHPGAQR